MYSSRIQQLSMNAMIGVQVAISRYFRYSISVKKYVAIFKTAWQNSLTWRGNVFFYFTMSFLPLVGYYYLWSAIFQERAFTAGYDFNTLSGCAAVALIAITRKLWTIGLRRYSSASS